MIGPGSDNDKLGTYWILYLFPVVPVEQMARLEVDQSWGPHGNLNISLLKSKMTFANWTRSFPMMTIHCTQSPLRVVVRKKKRDLVGKIGSFSHIIPFFLTTTLNLWMNENHNHLVHLWTNNSDSYFVLRIDVVCQVKWDHPGIH